MHLDKEHKEWLALTLVPGVGTALFVRLLARFRTPGNVLNASEGELTEIVGPKVAERIKRYAEIVDVATQERLMEEFGACLVTLEDSDYPLRLAEIYDPPLALFARGAFHSADEYAVAIVGTRRPTPYGIRMAEKIAGELASNGITVVSGLAYGIDAAAHRGAMDAGGRTIAVLGNGVDIVYPPQNAELMERIVGQGCVISQFPMGTRPLAGHFPQRNRIISGMSMGTVVIEAPLKSGALITARQAAEQGREVFAVPGHVGVHNSEGPHALIREGAKLVESAEDILVELNLPLDLHLPAPLPPEPAGETSSGPRAARPASAAAAPAPATPKTSISETEKDVMAVLAPDGSFVDEIAAACRISVSEALSSLTMLELRGLVRQFSGKRFAPNVQH